MNERTPVAQGRMAILGAILILGGAIALVVSWTDFELDGRILDASWPIFVVVPGLVLLALASVPRPPAGVGFAIAGSIVTSVGVLLWYQEATGHWESWSYAWALIGPGAAGLGALGYGALTRNEQMVRVGSRLAAIGLGIFLVGAYFFETVFRSGRAPFDLSGTWPLILIGLGVVLIAVTVLGGRTTRGRPEDHVSGGVH